MTIIVSETGTAAAAGIESILRGAGDEVEAALGASEWAARQLAQGGWTALTAPTSDADLALRDLQEIARVSGRFLVPTALTVSLVAGRCFGMDEERLAVGVTFPVGGSGGSVLPYAVAGVRAVDRNGNDLEAGPDPEVDGFSAVLPLRPVSAEPLDRDRCAELLAVLAATAAGCADAVLDRTVGWVQTREQFGRPLKDFQALRHHLADMHIAREEAWTCAVVGGELPADAAEWACLGMQRAKKVIETAIQVHGGMGFTWETGLHHWLRHVLVLETLVTENA